MIEIKVGQVWKDKDKRREMEGTVRTFDVVQVGNPFVTVKERLTQRDHRFRRSRFGSGHTNDSFVLVKDADERPEQAQCLCRFDATCCPLHDPQGARD